jgi:hypothetical protein
MFRVQAIRRQTRLANPAFRRPLEFRAERAIQKPAAEEAEVESRRLIRDRGQEIGAADPS